MKIFDGMQSFFNSIGEYVKNFSNLFFIFLGVFLLVSVVIIIITSFAYECMMTKTIDRINKFLERNPRINDDNLVAFNNLMKANSVPKTLRKQWQQFMLYREHPASYYMSFQHCVENPMRNSTYRQQMTVYKVISYILVVLSLMVSTFMAVQSYNANLVLQDIIIIPLVILVAYWLISMVLDLVHSAISSDLFQNYQYFEINMDKAMLTLPEFVDYEVLFSQDEIRRGIPVLFAYLQKRAIQEQQELEKARLKSVDHEKFDFNEAGLDGSLVLDRAMRETENFTAQRKKYLQEIERVNNEIYALENNYREQIKDYQRQVQTSKETVENLKEQLEQASSTIEINYIKKQMRDEINRQQLAEKDFDILTDKHNQEIKSLNQEIKRYDDETKKAKEALETAMLSEFNTYSIKVYDNLEKIVDNKMQGKVDDYKDQIRGLEGQLEEKNEELENVYTRYQEVLSQIPEEQPQVEPETYEEEPLDKKSKKKKKAHSNEEPEDDGVVQPEQVDEYPVEQYDDYAQYDENQTQEYPNYSEEDANQYNYDNQNYDDNQEYVNNQDYDVPAEEYQADYGDGYIPLEDNENAEYIPVDDAYEEYVPVDDTNEEYVATTNSFDDNSNNEPVSLNQEYNPQEEYVPLEQEYIPLDDIDVNKTETQQEYVPLDKEEQKEENKDEFDFDDSDFNIDFDKPQSSTNESFEDMNFNFDFDDDKPSNQEQKQEVVVEDDEFDMDKILGLYDDLSVPQTAPQEEKVEDAEKTKEVEDVEVKEDSYADEAMKEELDEELPAPIEVKRKAGRPRKEVSEDEIKPKRSVGRPRKIVEEEEVKPKRSVGRPRKVVEDDSILEKPIRSVGRPRKETLEVHEKKRGRPRKEETKTATLSVKRSVGRPRKIVEEEEVKPKRSVGRPRKVAEDKNELLEKPVRSVGRPRKETSVVTNNNKGKRGRPRKS